MKKLMQYPVTIVFFLFLFAYTVLDILSPTRARSELENRPLQQAPVFSFSSLFSNEYTPKYEEYINDQFFMRDSWINLKSRCEYALLKEENNGIVYGTDGYQFVKLLTINEVQYRRNIGYIETFAENYPGQVTVMVVPSASVILADRLPANVPFADENACLNEIYTSFQNSGIEAIDLRQVLLEHNGQYIYYRTDHHWTTDGAYLAYLEYVNLHGLTPFNPEEHTRVEVPNFYGTNYSKSKLFSTIPDVLTYYDLPNQIEVNGGTYGIYELEKLETRDMYAMFLHGNNGFTTIQGNGTGRCLVIKDSYGNCFVPFLTENYAQIDVVDLRSMSTSVNDLIAENGYDNILILYNFQTFQSDNFLSKLILDL